MTALTGLLLLAGPLVGCVLGFYLCYWYVPCREAVEIHEVRTYGGPLKRVNTLTANHLKLVPGSGGDVENPDDWFWSRSGLTYVVTAKPVKGSRTKFVYEVFCTYMGKVYVIDCGEERVTSRDFVAQCIKDHFNSMVEEMQR